MNGWQRWSILATVCVLTMLVAQITSTLIDWRTVGSWLATGQFPPYLYTELRPALAPYIRDDDVLVTTHELMWTYPHHPPVYTYAAEPTAMRRWDLTDPVEVWERAQPTVVVHIENRMQFDPGLQAYMERHQFQVCQELDVLGTNIRLYRPNCSATT